MEAVTTATTEAATEVEHIRNTLRQVVLLRETGPKSAAWHRARLRTIWRLHARLERCKEQNRRSP